MKAIESAYEDQEFSLSAREFLELIDAREVDESEADRALIQLCSPSKVPSRQSHDTALHKRARKALHELKDALTELTYFDLSYRFEMLEHMKLAEAEHAKTPDFKPSAVEGIATRVVWNCFTHLDVIGRAIDRFLVGVPRHRPKDDSKRRLAFAICWLAYEFRRKAGRPDPLPSGPNQIKCALSCLVQAELRVTGSTAEKFVSDNLALIRRALSGTLSPDEKDFISYARLFHLWGDQDGALAQLTPFEMDRETLEFRSRLGLF